jgi:Fur family peroxide stress response transcriptional regulator
MREKLNVNGQAVLEVVRAADYHPTALEVFSEVRKTRSEIGLASVYRILHNLTQQGIIRELKGGDDSTRYDGHVHRHDHAICTHCGALLDIPIDIPLTQESLEATAQATGIRLESYEIRLYGLCSNCQERAQVETAKSIHKTAEKLG